MGDESWDGFGEIRVGSLREEVLETGLENCSVSHGCVYLKLGRVREILFSYKKTVHAKVIIVSGWELVVPCALLSRQSIVQRTAIE